MAPVGTHLRSAVRAVGIAVVLSFAALFAYSTLPGCTAQQVAKSAEIASAVIKAIEEVLPLFAAQDPAGVAKAKAAIAAGDERLAALVTAKMIMERREKLAADPRQSRLFALIVARAEVE